MISKNTHNGFHGTCARHYGAASAEQLWPFAFELDGMLEWYSRLSKEIA